MSLDDKKNTYLKVENLTKYFGSEDNPIKAVDKVSFSVDKGEIVLIMGPSGSGKTTLLMMIGALLLPTEGSVYYEGKDITTFSQKQLATIRIKDLGFIFQSFNLLNSLNTLENVSIILELNKVKTKEAKKRAKKVLTRLGLLDRLNHDITKLSGGEKQRVSVARALIANPTLILADEPTANLDSKSGHKVMEFLKKIAKEDKKAVIIVSHDMRILDIADRVIWLEDGKIKDGYNDTVVDPVCEMKLEKVNAPYHLKKVNQVHYFCSKKCLNTFKDTSEPKQ